MSINSFGHLLRMTTWGESHGPAIGAVVDGCPPGIELDEAAIQHWLDRRRPGLSRHTSPRQEPDVVRILSGVFEGRTTGTPISLMIDNVDARSGDYPADAPFRPGHADFAYQAKYGIRDHRGGGRASARETAARVAAGAVARLVIPEVTIAEPDRRDRRRSELRVVGGDARWGAGGGGFTGCGSRMCRERSAGRVGRAGLCQARCRAGRGLHGNQRGQRGRDRRGVWRGAAEGERERRRRRK